MARFPHTDCDTALRNKHKNREQAKRAYPVSGERLFAYGLRGLLQRMPQAL